MDKNNLGTRHTKEGMSTTPKSNAYMCEVLTALTTKNSAYSDGIPFSLVECYKCYAVTCCLHVQILPSSLRLILNLTKHGMERVNTLC